MANHGAGVVAGFNVLCHLQQAFEKRSTLCSPIQWTHAAPTTCCSCLSIDAQLANLHCQSSPSQKVIGHALLKGLGIVLADAGSLRVKLGP